MKISILGLGWYGEALGLACLRHGHTVKGSTRTSQKADRLQDLGLAAQVLRPATMAPQELLAADWIILNIPPSSETAKWIMSWDWKTSAKVIFISSTSVYGEGQCGMLTEALAPLPSSENGKILLEQEAWVKAQFNSWIILRFGGLLGRDRHPGRVLSGRKAIPLGQHPVNLIHQEDAVGLTLALLDAGPSGLTLNGVCDEHSSRDEFYGEFCHREGLPQPEFQKDESLGKLVSNETAKSFYAFKWPRLIGRSL